MEQQQMLLLINRRIRIKGNIIFSDNIMKKKMIFLILLVTLLNQVRSDCLIAKYPRRTTIGSIKAQVDSVSAQLQPILKYSYPLVQQLEYQGTPRAMVVINGIGTSFIPEQFGFDLKIQFPEKKSSHIQFQVSFFGIQVPSYNQPSFSIWKMLQFTFMVTQSPQLILGNLPLYNVIPTDIPNTLKVSTDIAILDEKVKFSQAITHIFISGFQYQQIKKDVSSQSIKENNKILSTIQKIQQLRDYSWNIELIKKFTKILKSHQNPGLTIKNPSFSVGYGNSGLERRRNVQGIRSPSRDFTKIGTLHFDIAFTNRLKIIHLSYSYIVYLKEEESKNFYRHLDGTFSGSNGQIKYFTPLKNDGMTFVGINGFNFNTNGQHQQKSFDFQMNVGKSSNIGNQFFYMIKILSDNETSFDINYFGIQVLDGLECADCPYSPIIFDHFCVSKCPSDYIFDVNQYGARFCKQCDASKFMIPDENRKNCICAHQHFLVPSIQQCQRCPKDCLTCEGTRCLTCDTDPPTTHRILNPRTSRCQCPKSVGLNQVGYYDDTEDQFTGCRRCNNRCLNCFGGEMNQCLSCSPQKNRRLLNGFCACLPNFIEKQIGPGLFQCLCLPPYQLNSRRQCVLNQRYCPSSQIFVNNMCLCPPGVIRNPITNLCVAPCESNQYFNQLENKCVCRQGSVFNIDKQKCEYCNQIANKIYNKNTNRCECKPGFSQNSYKQCISCPSNSFYNPHTDSCFCIFNFYKDHISNKCQKCQEYSNHQQCQGGKLYYLNF